MLGSRIKVYDANSNGTKGVAFPGVSSSLRISHPALNQHLILEYKNGLQSFVMIRPLQETRDEAF